MSRKARGDDNLGGFCHLLDFQSVKQKRVTRSTFAAELNDLADSLEQTHALRYMLEEFMDKRLNIGGTQ
eukprot:3579448-Amphidinium_carterae.1